MKNRRAGIEKLDLEEPVLDRCRLPDQLVHPLVSERSDTVPVHVRPVAAAWRLPIEQHPEPDRVPARLGCHDEIQVPGVEPVGDLPSSSSGDRPVRPDGPRPGESPSVEGHARGNRVSVGLATHDAPGRGKVLRPPRAEIVLPGSEVLPVGRCFCASRVDTGGAGVEVPLSGFLEQLADDPLGLVVSVLPEHLVPETTV